MNLDHLQQKLLACGPQPIAERLRAVCLREAHYGAPARSAGARSLGTLGRALWRAAAPCVALMLLFGVWSFVGTNNANPSGMADGGDFSQHFEQTMLAAVDDVEDAW
jgi:hypothetical protein